MLFSDVDLDGTLKPSEFASLPHGRVEETQESMDEKWVEERLKEFNEIIDVSKDGFVTKDELMV